LKSENSKEIENLSKEELINLVKQYREFIEQIPPEVKFWMDRYGLPIRVVRLDMREWVGQIVSTRWELKEIEVGVFDTYKNYSTGEKIKEKKIMLLPWNVLRGVDFILETEIEPPEQPQE